MRFSSSVPSCGFAWKLAAFGAAAVAAIPAQAGNCDGAAIGTRYVEALRFCGTQAAAAPVKVEPVELPERSSVSVSMPGFQKRLAQATRAVRARGGGGNDALIASVAYRYRINPHLLASMVNAESAGRQRAVSNKGALGLMQVMPATARGLGVRDPRALLDDPVLAMHTGAKYLKQLQGQLGNNVPLVVAAYNAGPGAVIKAGRKVPRYRETQAYVKKVVGRYQAAQFGRAR
ncbi:lytic transglycosylase domain-containing protein [Sphingomonas psychrotolerans]|uniref:Lytic transglycosylase domain-containing protein n=1 Tax=Sphingomonas psychrotolerans TaxID=1327635 RepID=A0ABU3MZH3_9SPHN|nr:lytic transglycosylase domain-containing protein [Sphingomonas psychrotolerans]MDT8757376.1 lytic transglycosylase domain-containing protein [Sphingomonas psychrotolerans]